MSGGVGTLQGAVSTTAPDSFVEVLRGSMTESRHRVHVAVVAADGGLRATSGDPDLVTFFRSAAKPFQALPLVEDGLAARFALTTAELALCCGSHSGTRSHVQAAESILGKVGMTSEALACGPHPPFDERARRALADAGLQPGRVHNNCSGKHAGMLVLAHGRGWEPAGYHHPGHPVQQRALAEVARWSGVRRQHITVAIDGCGVACFALPLRAMAQAYATFAGAAQRAETGPAELVSAMTSHPEMVAGAGRLCTDLMRQTEGRVFAKVGAEGVYCVGIPDAELGIAIKVEDGASRAVGPAILATLRALQLISEDDLDAMHEHAHPALVNTRGDTVGELRPAMHLQVVDA